MTTNKSVFIIAAIWCGLLALVPEDLRRTQDCLMFVALFALVSAQLWKKIKPVVGIAYGYFTITASIALVFPREFFRGFDLETIAGFEALVSQGILTLTLTALIATFANLSRAGQFFRILAYVNALVLCSKWALGGVPHFLLSNPAWDATFVAIMLPFFFERTYSGAKTLLYFIPLIPLILACFITDSSSGIAGFGIALGTYLWAKDKFSLRATVSLVLIGLGVTALGVALQGEALLVGSGRFHIWELAVEFIQTEGKRFGQGIGTFHVYGPTLQLAELMRQGLKDVEIPGFMWMHNEWLQVLFEAGYLGLGMAAAVFTTAIYEARKAPAKFAALMTFGALAFTQPLLRNHLTAVLGAYLLVMAFRPAEESRGEPTCHH